MRLVICSISLIVTTFAVVGCGQTGDLQLANSPNYDNRAKYLLYSNTESKSSQAEKKVEKQVAPEVNAEAASEVTSN